MTRAEFEGAVGLGEGVFRLEERIAGALPVERGHPLTASAERFADPCDRGAMMAPHVAPPPQILRLRNAASSSAPRRSPAAARRRAGRRASYASKEECLADWGDPKECEEQAAASGSTARSWGPVGRHLAQLQQRPLAAAAAPAAAAAAARAATACRAAASARADRRRHDPRQRRSARRTGAPTARRSASRTTRSTARTGTSRAATASRAEEIDTLEAAAAELHARCLDAVEHIVTHNRLAQLAIPEAWRERVARSWRAKELSLFGRFDFAYDGNGPAEAPRVQRRYADGAARSVGRAVALARAEDPARRIPTPTSSTRCTRSSSRAGARSRSRGRRARRVHFTCAGDSEEDRQSRLPARRRDARRRRRRASSRSRTIGWDADRRRASSTSDNEEIRVLCKLYPWEWLAAESFGPHLLRSTLRVIEPAWKMLLSNKGMLPILWELFPDHPNLLPAYFEPGASPATTCKKPLLSREGANVTIHRSGREGARGGRRVRRGGLRLPGLRADPALRQTIRDDRRLDHRRRARRHRHPRGRKPDHAQHEPLRAPLFPLTTNEANDDRPNRSPDCPRSSLLLPFARAARRVPGGVPRGDAVQRARADPPGQRRGGDLARRARSSASCCRLRAR